MNTQNNSRRELKVRKTKWVAKTTKQLVATSITPNQISLLSVLFSLLAGLSFYSFSHTYNVIFLLFAAVCIQLRLLCNLFDGLVAIEGGKGTKSGDLFNDIPDRLADVFIIVGAGLATNSDYGLQLAWGTAMLAVLTAYIRTLGGSLGAPISFAGPMAKQHRMAILTGVSLLSIIEWLWWETNYILLAGLWVMMIGGLLTCWKRIRTIYRFLENQAD